MKIDTKLITAIDLLANERAKVTIEFNKVEWNLASPSDEGPTIARRHDITLEALTKMFSCKPIGDCYNFNVVDINDYLEEFLEKTYGFRPKSFDYCVCGVECGKIHLEGLYDITEEMRNDSPEARDYANRIEDAVHRKAQMDFAIRKLIRDTEVAMNDRGCTMEERMRRIDEITAAFRKDWGGIEMD